MKARNGPNSLRRLLPARPADRCRAMPARAASKSLRLPKPLRIARNHARLFAALALGAVIFFALPMTERLATRILIGWDVAVAVYLALAFILIARFDLALVRRRAASQDEGGLLILILT